MSTAQHLFIIYAASALTVGFVLGGVLGVLRANAPQVRPLATAHVEILMQSSMHFGLAFAVGAVGFASGWATTGAWLLVIGSAMQATGATANWLTKTDDQFAERSVGLLINSASSFLMFPGLAITVVGLLTNL